MKNRLTTPIELHYHKILQLAACNTTWRTEKIKNIFFTKRNGILIPTKKRFTKRFVNGNYSEMTNDIYKKNKKNAFDEMLISTIQLIRKKNRYNCKI